MRGTIDQDRPASTTAAASDGLLDSNSSRCSGPGARKWPLLVTAPITQRVLLFGGYGYAHSDVCTATGRRHHHRGADKSLHYQYQQLRKAPCIISMMMMMAIDKYR